MSNFEYSIAKVLENEGRYEHPSPSDPGGETYCGIARAFWPAWGGWVVVDSYKEGTDFPANLAGALGLDDFVKSFYLKNFWHFEGVLDPDVAEKLLDIWVNLGPERAPKVLQTALRGIGAHVSLDGSYGPETENAVNSVKKESLLPEVRAQLAYHYATTAKPVYLLGLLRRAVK